MTTKITTITTIAAPSKMVHLFFTIYATLTATAIATSVSRSIIQAPALPGAQAISPQDRLYSADQSSNTVTVIKPATNEVLGTIALGDSRVTDVLGPQYLKVVNSHGLGFSQSGEYVCHVSVTSNTLTVIRTIDNSIVSQTFVDRASHEAFFAHDNRTVWVGCRGTNYVDLVDGIKGGVIGRVETNPGPSKVLFSPDGEFAYVNHILSATLQIIHVPTRKVIYTISGLADIFSSDMMLSADGKRLWVVHKMVGKTSVIDVDARRIVCFLDTGEESNHPNFVVVNGTTFGYITVAATNETKVYQQDNPSQAPVFIKGIRSSGIEPHGIWPSPDNTRIYWVNEHSDTLDVVDTSSMSVLHTLPIGQESQALVYVAGAVTSGNGTQNLGRQGLDKRVENRLVGVTNSSTATALFTVREEDGLDMFQIIGRQLEINKTYVATAVCHTCNGARLSVVSFDAVTPIKGEMGCAVAPQVLSFLDFFNNFDVDSIRLQLL